jgi:hypothetical protein
MGAIGAAVDFDGPRRVIHLTKYVVLLSLASLLSACGVTRGQLEAAATFGKSATALADGVKNAYAQAAQDEADIRTAKYVVLSSRHSQ